MKWILVFSCLWSLNAAAGMKSLVTVIGSNMAAPFLLDTPNKESDPQGLSADYMRELGRLLGQKIEIRVLPKFRIREAFEKGEIDLNCYTTKEWAGNESDKFQWSVPLFVVTDRLVSVQKPVNTLTDVRKETVATVLRYSYPGAFEEAIKKGDIIRDEVKTEEALLNMLAKKRVNFGVIGDVQLKYFLKLNPKASINSTSLALSENIIRCWVRRDSSLTLERLNAAIEQMKTSGSLDTIFAKYR